MIHPDCGYLVGIQYHIEGRIFEDKEEVVWGEDIEEKLLELLDEYGEGEGIYIEHFSDVTQLFPCPDWDEIKRAIWRRAKEPRGDTYIPSDFRLKNLPEKGKNHAENH